jgi:predicted secreted protein
MGIVYLGAGSGGGGGASYDQSLNTTDSVAFAGLLLGEGGELSLANGTQITVGTFDNATGGYGGISLHCAVGYELNWQGGRLKSVMIGDESSSPQTIHCDSPLAFHGGTTPGVVDAGSTSGTYTTDASSGDVFDLTLNGNITLANPDNPVDGKTIRWRIKQDATGSRTVTLGDKFVIPSSATSPLPFSTTADKMDVLAATYHAGRDKWDIVAFVMGY